MTNPTTIPTATIVKDVRTIDIAIANGETFELPTRGHFGGYGKFKEGSYTELEPGYSRGYAFTPITVSITLTNQVISDLAAFGAENFSPGLGDACQQGRELRTQGLASAHWPQWLTDVVGDALKRHGVA